MLILIPGRSTCWLKIEQKREMGKGNSMIGKKYKLLVLCLALLLCFGAGCGAALRADLSAYQDEPIRISGLTDEDFTITPGELAGLDCETGSATGKTQKAGTIYGVGPTLDTFLAQYNRKQTDFSKIIFTAKDGYYTSLSSRSLEKYVIILSLANGGEPLSENEAPLRLVIPEAESNRWVRMVTTIEFVPDR